MLLQDFSRKIFRIVGSISLEDVNLVKAISLHAVDFFRIILQQTERTRKE